MMAFFMLRLGTFVGKLTFAILFKIDQRKLKGSLSQLVNNKSIRIYGYVNYLP